MTADEIRREIDASRRAIQGDYATFRTTLREELDFGGKARRSVVSHPVPWLSGAAVLGFLLSPHKKTRPVRGAKGRAEAVVAEPAKKLTLLGVALTAGRLLLPLARPALTTFATQKLASYASRFSR